MSSTHKTAISLTALLAATVAWMGMRTMGSGDGGAMCSECLPLPEPVPLPGPGSASAPAPATAPIPAMVPVAGPPAPAAPLMTPVLPSLPAFFSPSLPDFMVPSTSPPPPPKFPLPYPEHADAAAWAKLSPAERLKNVRERVKPLLKTELEKNGMRLGAQVYLRAFKDSRELELWVKVGASWEKFRTYPIAGASGILGPKLREGDGQVPEGFYTFGSGAMNPASSFHLSFNIGYPNAFDRHHQRTGGDIMVHGSCVSVGCLAMTDPVIEEIYLMVEAAQNAGQGQVPVHIFPFAMTAERLALAPTAEVADFWRSLMPAYEWFETKRQPPQVRVRDGKYEVVGAPALADQD